MLPESWSLFFSYSHSHARIGGGGNNLFPYLLWFFGWLVGWFLKERSVSELAHTDTTLKVKISAQWLSKLK